MVKEYHVVFLAGAQPVGGDGQVARQLVPRRLRGVSRKIGSDFLSVHVRGRSRPLLIMVCVCACLLTPPVSSLGWLAHTGQSRDSPRSVVERGAAVKYMV